MKETTEVTYPDSNTIGADLSVRSVLHPDDVLADPRMSKADKKALLASWASDVRGVRDAPGYRQIDSGAIVEVDDIMRALGALDGVKTDKRPTEHLRRQGALLLKWRNRFWRRNGPDDDNNQPPPCPAAAYPLARKTTTAVGTRPEWA